MSQKYHRGIPWWCPTVTDYIRISLNSNVLIQPIVKKYIAFCRDLVRNYYSVTTLRCLKNQKIFDNFLKNFLLHIKMDNNDVLVLHVLFEVKEKY